MAVLASTIIDRVQTTLFDATAVRWSEAELLDYLNAGLSALVANKPDVYTQVTNYALTNNSSKQTLPSNGIQLVDITRVVGGRAMRQIERGHLDATDPNWYNRTGTPEYFTYDPRYPDNFWVYPTPTTGTTNIELIYAAQPARITQSDPIPVDDLYENALYYFTLAMAYAKNTLRGDLSKSSMYAQMFSAAIGAKTQVQISYAPRPSDASSGTNR